MKRVVFLTASVFVASGAFANSSYFGRWNWPLVSEWQSYETDSQGAKEGTVGGLEWPSTDPLDDPFQAARYGTLNQGVPATATKTKAKPLPEVTPAAPTAPAQEEKAPPAAN